MVLNTNSDNMMQEFRKMMERKHSEDMLFIEKQMQMFEALTQKRMEMVRAIRVQQPGSIRELATFLDRDVKNVFDDVQLLNRMHIIRLVRIGRAVRPVIKKKFIVISLE
jgi:predicted transcriptional regulator